jgi:hypothetical protein
MKNMFKTHIDVGVVYQHVERRQDLDDRLDWRGRIFVATQINDNPEM